MLFAIPKCVAPSLIPVIASLAFLDVADPMYWLGDGGLFGSAILIGVMVIIFIETGLLFPFLPGDTLLFTAGMIAAQSQAPVDIWALAPCAMLAAILGSQCGYLIGRCWARRCSGSLIRGCSSSSTSLRPASSLPGTARRLCCSPNSSVW